MNGTERGTDQGDNRGGDRAAGVRALARRWWPLAAAIPLGAVAGAGYAVAAPPVYTANSYVVVVPDSSSEAGLAVNFAQAYGRLAAQPQVLALAAPDAGRSGAELAGLVAGTTSPDAPVIEIAGSGGHPVDAVKAADAVAKALISFANTSSKETGVKLVPLAAAAEPDKPTTPSRQLDVAVGGAAGVLVGALAMMARRKPSAAGPVATPVATPSAAPEPLPVPTPAAAVPAPQQAEPARSKK
ncbi:Wzz/FepE/Etk N-terminal domain-containing protein [Kitasatospora sp. GAS1066B]|uniref:Wzz/FepE/Etk N-terminal domain-containing protein n=1 Tax=Kitasatospora sp. GAS1066B TaxID=3156271 RepID=UPI003514D8BF